MNQGIAEVAVAALRTTLGLSCLPQLLLLATAGFLLATWARASLPRVIQWAALPLLYAALAMGDRGVMWPLLDSPGAALRSPLAWTTAALALLALRLAHRDEDSNWRWLLPLALVAVAALSRPGQDPVALLQLRGALGETAQSGKIFLFHWVQGCALTAAMSAAAFAGRRVATARPTLGRPMRLTASWMLGLWAASFVTGLYGMFCGMLLLRWPA